MGTRQFNGQTLDARPDRVDFRDRVYTPRLIGLPASCPEPAQIKKYFAAYAKTLVLNQFGEGACTGFGLAAVINHMQWRQAIRAGEKGVVSVSPRMIYQLARQYDEWPGEDYDGSSCRGAMKGWHRHGVCSAEQWPYAVGDTPKFIKPKKTWTADAATRPLGAYYRVDKDSIADIQAAIHEVGAVFVSADVHAGWALDPCKELPVIGCDREVTGGHAFALVGYTPQGFIVQNSWGTDWGHQGFAVMTYEDWVLHGGDAWVAAMGAPMAGVTSERSFSTKPLRERQSAPAAALLPKVALASSNPATRPWTESQAYEHSVVLGNNGLAQSRYIDVENAAAAVKLAAYELPLAWLKKQKKPRIAIYAHGGLNDEAASIKRIRVMAPYFAANGVYPLFLTWRTGFVESICGILDDALASVSAPKRATGSWEWAQDAADRAIEAISERVLVKPIWSQIKQNAEAATLGGHAGLVQLAAHLRALTQALPGLEIHLIGHSAGSLLLGHLLDLARAAPGLKAHTATLYAPACTLAFTHRHFVPALHDGALAAGTLQVHVMSEAREQADKVGPYSKSLLYLVSRALETVHKMPLLGMEAAWRAGAGIPEDVWSGLDAVRRDVADWRAWHAKAGVVLKVHGEERVRTGIGAGQNIPLSHGSFDNDIDVVTDTLLRIRGGEALAAAVENLQID